jgi:hypothetical protein
LTRFFLNRCGPSSQSGCGTKERGPNISKLNQTSDIFGRPTLDELVRHTRAVRDAKKTIA